MATTKQLTEQVDALEKKVSQLTMRNSQLLDEVSLLKKNYSTLVTEVSQRFEVLHERFRKS
tara:strand:+ start:957 stop:1139 length:183 start_codon:yes stop_codon:yes gene_type:complete